MGRNDKINLRCVGCGNVTRTPRYVYEPEAAVEVTNGHCDICDTGGFTDDLHWFDKEGRELDFDTGLPVG